MINKHRTTGLIIGLVFLFIGCSIRYLKNPNNEITFTYDEGNMFSSLFHTLSLQVITKPCKKVWINNSWIIAVYPGQVFSVDPLLPSSFLSLLNGESRMNPDVCELKFSEEEHYITKYYQAGEIHDIFGCISIPKMKNINVAKSTTI